MDPYTWDYFTCISRRQDPLLDSRHDQYAMFVQYRPGGEARCSTRWGFLTFDVSWSSWSRRNNGGQKFARLAKHRKEASAVRPRG
jgi:hypothetical protein